MHKVHAAVPGVDDPHDSAVAVAAGVTTVGGRCFCPSLLRHGLGKAGASGAHSSSGHHARAMRGRRLAEGTARVVVVLFILAPAATGCVGSSEGSASESDAEPHPDPFSWTVPTSIPRSAVEIYEELYGQDPVVEIGSVGGAAVFPINNPEPDYEHPEWIQLERLVAETCDAAVDSGRVLQVRAGVDASGQPKRNLVLLADRGERTRERLKSETCLSSDAQFVLAPHALPEQPGPPDQTLRRVDLEWIVASEPQEDQ